VLSVASVSNPKAAPRMGLVPPYSRFVSFAGLKVDTEVKRTTEENMFTTSLFTV
jgi:hypothetical protein